MPTSPYGHIHAFTNFLNLTKPASILDIGLGNGKMGFIARDILDVGFNKSYRMEDWQVRIDGIEIFPDYIQVFQEAIYDNIYIGNAFEVIDGLGPYDMIIMGDVLEHFEKTQALELLNKCFTLCLKWVIICIPLGDQWNQPEIYGNPHEKHLSSWEYEEFKPFVCAWELFKYAPGQYGAFLAKKEDYLAYRVNSLISRTGF